MRVFIVLAALCLVCAQDAPADTPAEGAPAPGGPVDPMMMVGMQSMMASKLLDAVLRFQHAQSETMAGSFFMYEAQTNMQAQQSLEEDGDNDFNLEEEASLDESHPSASKYRLMAAYHLLNSVHVKLYQILVKAPEIQQEYYMNRVIQMSVGAAGGQFPPQLMQVMYMQTMNTHMKTLKLSHALQYVSHFRTWLEDEIDVGTAIVGEDDDFATVAQQQEDDLLVDKTFAFRTYQTLATLDFYTFMLDMYVQQIFMSLAAQQGPPPAQAPGAASFLEEESTEQAQFVPFMAGMMMGGAPNGVEMWTMWIRFYQLLLQLQAAQSAQYSVTLEHFAENVENSDSPPEGADTEKIGQAAKWAFMSFAAHLTQSAHMQMILAMFGLYQFFAPGMMGGQFGQYAMQGEPAGQFSHAA